MVDDHSTAKPRRTGTSASIPCHAQANLSDKRVIVYEIRRGVPDPFETPCGLTDADRQTGGQTGRFRILDSGLGVSASTVNSDVDLLVEPASLASRRLRPHASGTSLSADLTTSHGECLLWQADSDRRATTKILW